jgi:uncharacterized protein
MFLDIHELERHPLDFEEVFQPDVIDLGGEARQRTPLKASGHAEIVEEHHGKHEVITDIRLRGRLSAGLELQCARCVEPVAQDIVREFELLYRPLGADAGRDELSVTDAEAEIGYYQGDGLLLEDVLRVHCGKNLNEEQCSCTTAIEDPRWTALREIRSKLEH